MADGNQQVIAEERKRLAEKIQKLVLEKEAETGRSFSDDSSIAFEKPVVTKKETLEAKKETVDNESLEVDNQETKVDNLTLELTDIEKQAFEMGWRPRNQYSGEHFVEAAEYVNRAPLFNRIEQQKKELQELKDTMRKMTEHMSLTQKYAYEKARTDLEARRQDAISQADIERVRAVEKDINRLDSEVQQSPLNQVKVPQEKPQPHPASLEFESRNSDWFNTKTPENRRMYEAALFIEKQMLDEANELGRKLDHTKYLPEIERRIKANFPHRFAEQNKQIQNTQPVIPEVSKSTTSRNSVRTGSTLIAKLTAEQLAMGKRFEQTSKGKDGKPRYTLEQYAKDLQIQGAPNLK